MGADAHSGLEIAALVEIPTALPSILACVDASAYAASVCDYAAWFAGRFDLPVTLLNAVEGGERSAGRELLGWAGARLEGEGVSGPAIQLSPGPFREVVGGLAETAQLIVLGKRGESSGESRANLGGNVDLVLRSVKRPVCLVSQYFLPITRALVLLDARAHHRRTVDFITKHTALHRLQLDLVLIDDAGQDYVPKLEWAREKLGAHDARVFPIQAHSPDDAAMQYLQSHGSDLLILSREVLLADPDARFAVVAPGSLWAWRTPVLVC